MIRAFDSTGNEIGRNQTVIWCETGTSTQVTGTLVQDTIWSPTNGPFIVVGSITIPSRVTLVLQPGTTVCFDSAAELVVADGGRLVADGTETEPISFVSKPNAASRWKGITVRGSIGSPESRLSNVYLQGNDSTAIHSVGGSVFLDRVRFGTADRQYLSLDDSSFVVQDCLFPTGIGEFELVHGTGGIKPGGRGLFLRNFFGATSGYSDVIDFTGGNRGEGQIVEFIENVFAGTSDDHIDLDGTDAWVEGNIFLHAHKNGSPDTASGVSGGNSGTRTSEITIIRNIFFDCDHAAMAKQGNFYVLLNNTIVHQSHIGGLDNDGAVICLADEGTTEGAGMYLEGNIVFDIEKLTRNHRTATVTFNRNLLPLEWTGPGTGNLVSDPMFVHVPDVSETNFKNWTEAQVMWKWLSLRPMSPAKWALDGSTDFGAVVFPGVYLVGEPEPVTTNTTIAIQVRPRIADFGVPGSGWPLGAGYTHYKWQLDNGTWSELIPLPTPITFVGLEPGRHTVRVIGIRDSGYAQSCLLYTS
ncbi:MAG: hypothetical protein N3G20_03795, partial [Verrucomicrobiae bacterium]|nr:hypothetical protein [Verrucomicrobiae bacterium]